MNPIRHYMQIVEAIRPLPNQRRIAETTMKRLPRKFWLNPTTEILLACTDHVSAVLEDWQEMGISEAEIREWKEHLSQWEGEDYEDALDENQGDLLHIAMRHGWVRGGDEGGVFLHQDNKNLLRSAARFLRDHCGIDEIIVRLGNVFEGRLAPHELDLFIKIGRFPR